ncbi:MAG: response regulator [Deltaproteobacteria bacterium]|nr:response regulator [Deltaproteobacteria bacterium]
MGRARILVVDDSPTIRRVVSAILERHGYDPSHASDGEDALEALTSGDVKADLVLLDFVMPRMNGYQFCRALRAHPELALTPVVLMSAKSDRIRDQFVQQTGALDAITKPFDAQALVAVVDNVLHRVSSGRASSARLPDLPEEPEETPEPIERETTRTHIAQIVATKLAHIVSRILTEKPTISPGELAATLTERLAKDALLEMVEAVRDVERTGVNVSRHVLSGDLGVVPIGAILQLLSVECQTGVLVCTSGHSPRGDAGAPGAEVVATFRNGLVDLVQSNGAGDEFRLGRFFVEEGILTPEQIDDVMKRSDAASSAILSDPTALPPPAAGTGDDAPLSRVNVKNEIPKAYTSDPIISTRTSQIPDTLRDDVPSDPHNQATLPGLPLSGRPTLTPPTLPSERNRLLGATLLAFGKITESQLRSALTRQSSELLYEVLRWPKGRFEFRAEPASEIVQSARLGLSVASMVMEGFRRVDEWRVLERTLGSFDAVLLRDDIALASLDMGTLPAREQTVLDAVDGERTVRGVIAASHMSSFDACRVLVQFLEARVLRKRAG